jgi:hypothetical protein
MAMTAIARPGSPVRLKTCAALATGTQGSSLIGVCAQQDGASFAPRALRLGQNSDWRLHTPGETAMKPFGGESCWRFSLLVVVSLASSCYCVAIVQPALLA